MCTSFFLIRLRNFLVFNVAHAFVAFLYFFVFVFVQVAGFAYFKPFYVDFLNFRDYTLFIKEST